MEAIKPAALAKERFAHPVPGRGLVHQANVLFPVSLVWTLEVHPGRQIGRRTREGRRNAEPMT